MIEMNNSELPAAEEALAAIGKTRMPMVLALKFMKVRRAIADRNQDVQEVRNNLILELSGGKRSIAPDHPRWQEFAERNDELLRESFKVPAEPFVLYERQNGEGPEYSWSENFKSRLVEIESDVLFGLGELLEIRALEKKEGEVDG